MLLIFFIIQTLLFTTVSSVSDSRTSPSHTDDLIYVDTAISPFFDGGASSSLLSNRVPSMLSKQSEEKNLVASMTDEKKKKPPIGKKHASIRSNKQDSSSGHVQTIRSGWTPEKRKRQAEISRFTSLKKKPESDITSKAWWTEERRKKQAERTRKIRTGTFHSYESKMKMSKSRLGKIKSQATKDKIREAIKRSHALRKKQKLNNIAQRDHSS